MSEYNIVTSNIIDSGAATDAYFERTEQALQNAGRNPDVVAEITADQFGDDEFEVLGDVYHEDGEPLSESLGGFVRENMIENMSTLMAGAHNEI